ncbi:MAG TPA: plasmid stabilization protein [Verrucomicrobiales bacterium]|nr:plasmid stabilization protein [Verrucomicrobiales bacterium]
MRETVRYYGRISPRLPGLLREELDSAVGRIRRNPLGFPLVEGDWRKCRLKRFPYGLIYRIKDDVVQVIAFTHHKRQPGYWLLRGRD